MIEKQQKPQRSSVRFGSKEPGQPFNSVPTMPKPAEPVSASAGVPPILPSGSKSKRPALRIVLGAVISLVALVIIVLIVGAVGLYRLHWQNKFTDELIKIVPYPAVTVNWQFVPYQTYRDDIATLNFFYTAQSQSGSATSVAKPSDEYLKKSVLSRLVRDTYIAQAAKGFNLSVTDADVTAEFDKIVAQAGDRTQVITTLQQLYNWNETQFKEKVLRPYLLRSKVQEHIATDGTINADAKSKAEEVLALVKKGDTSFEELAKQYSEDSTATNGGDLGFFGKGEMVTAFENAAFALKPGEVSGLVQTQYGYHIIKLIERTAATADKPEQLHAEHILIKTKDVDTWLNEQLDKQRIMVFISGFQMKKTCGLVLAKAETCENNELTNQAATDATTVPTDTPDNTNAATNSNTNRATTNTNQ